MAEPRPKRSALKKSDSDYDRKKNKDVKCELCGVKLKYGSLARHFKAKHSDANLKEVRPPGQVNTNCCYHWFNKCPWNRYLLFGHLVNCFNIFTTTKTYYFK